MPANEFEKQVQQKMDEFRLEPSAAVWQKVEEEIRKKKRRRIIFFFILPAAITLIALSVYYFINNSDTKSETTREQAISNEQKTGNTDKIKKTEENETTNENKENNIRLSLKKQAGLSNTNTNKKTEQQASVARGKNNVRVSIADPVKHKPIVTGSKNVVKNRNREIKEDNSLVVSNDIPAKQTPGKPTEDSESNKEKNSIELKFTEINANKMEPGIGQKNSDQPKTDSIASDNIAKSNEPKEISPKKKTTSSKIKWGIDFSAGISGSSENAFSFISLENKSRNDLVNSPGSSTGTPSGQRIILPPSSIYPGISFRMGITAELQISKKSRFSTGLQYAYLTSKVNTGGKQDSAINLSNNNNNYSAAQVNVFYRGAQQNKYTNNFHFIQVPLWYHLRLNKGKKLPLQWNMGLSFGYLFSTNGLVYDTSYGGIYYHNKRAFNKFHFNLATGLSFRLKGKNNSEWILGPELSFDMKKLINNPVGKKQYLMYGGISTRFLFPQKKR